MKNLIILLGMITNSYLFAEEAPSGCLVKLKDRVAVDPSCKCLDSNSCAKPKKINYDSKFYSQVDPQTKAPIFSEIEKTKMKEAYDVYNKIMELKAVGKRNSPEISQYYAKLSVLNSELDKLIRQNHPKMMAKADKREAEVMKKFKAREKRRSTVLSNYVKGQKVELALDKKGSSSTEKSPIVDSKEVVNESVKETSKAAISNSIEVKKEDLSDEDKENILSNIKEKDYKNEESDTLFEKISKAYKGKAYKKLLQPKPKSK